MFKSKFQFFPFRTLQVAACLGLGMGLFLSSASAEPPDYTGSLEAQTGFINGYDSVCHSGSTMAAIQPLNLVSMAIYSAAFERGVAEGKNNWDSTDSRCYTKAERYEAKLGKALMAHREAEKNAIYGNSRWR